MMRHDRPRQSVLRSGRCHRSGRFLHFSGHHCLHPLCIALHGDTVWHRTCAVCFIPVDGFVADASAGCRYRSGAWLYHYFAVGCSLQYDDGDKISQQFRACADHLYSSCFRASGGHCSSRGRCCFPRVITSDFDEWICGWCPICRFS